MNGVVSVHDVFHTQNLASFSTEGYLSSNTLKVRIFLISLLLLQRTRKLIWKLKSYDIN